MHCFTPMLGGRYLRDVHIVEGAPYPYSGESIYRLNPDAKTITYTYFASDGGYSTGVAEAENDGLRFADDYVGPGGEHTKMRVSWVRNGADAYSNRVEVLEKGAWRELWSTRFEKVSQATATD